MEVFERVFNLSTMNLLKRILLLLFCVALLVAVGVMYLETTRHSTNHIVTYLEKWRGLREIRQGSLYGILAWCILFARSEPTFVRIGLMTIIAAFVIMALPLKGY